MPRRSSSSSGGNRSSTRSASTSARQPTQAPAPAPVPHQTHSSVPTVQAPTSNAPGLFGQMASTAAGVAVGHTVGHGLSNMLFGGSGGSSSKEETSSTAPVQQHQSFEERRMGGQCDIPAKDFTRCLDATSGDIGSCTYYLEQLKACQSMYQSHSQQSSF